MSSYTRLIATLTTWLVLIGFTVSAQRPPVAEPPPVPEKLKNFPPVTDEMLLRPNPENWISFRNGYKLWGYSPLKQINRANVGQLRLVWSRAMQQGPQEIEPIVYNGVMYLANVEDIVQAVDATTGDLLWEYRRKIPPDIGRVTGTQFRYRNVALYEDKVYLATNDAYLVALDARTGKVVLETRRADYRAQVAQTFAPELDNVGRARADELLDAADLLLAWESWERLRVQQGCPAPRARRVLANALIRLLDPRE